MMTLIPPAPNSTLHDRYDDGFTIVELLIVIVVIAILAAISIVSYQGIQRRANNAGVVDAASKSLRMIQAYVATNSTYPLINGNACITSSSGCLVSTSFPVSANATFDTAIAAAGTIPRSIPVIGSDRYGITYVHTPGRTMDGVIQPAIIIYYLDGVNQPCGVGRVATEFGGDVNVLVTSSVGYTAGDDGGKTRCRVSIPGPSV